MNHMEQAIAEVRHTREAMNEASAKCREAERERGSLRDTLAALEANVASAEQAHVIADAAQQLGEDSNLEAARNALKEACKALADAAPELKHKIRVSELLVEKFTAAAQETSAKHQAALAALNAHQDEMLREQLREDVEKANRLADEWVSATEKAVATQRLVEERRRLAGLGVGWKEEELKWVVYKSPRHQDGNAIVGHVQALQALLAAATRA